MLAASAVVVAGVGVGSPAGGQGLPDLDPAALEGLFDGDIEGLIDCVTGADGPEAIADCLDLPDLDGLDLPDVDDLDIPGLDGGLCVEIDIDAEVAAGVQLWQIVAETVPEDVMAILVAKFSDGPVSQVVLPVLTQGSSATFELATPLGSKLEAAAVVAPNVLTGDIYVQASLSVSCTAAEDPGHGNGNGDGNGPGVAPPAPVVTGQPDFTG